MSDTLPPGWHYVTLDRYGEPCRPYYARTDGAAVWENMDDYWAKCWLPGHRRWSANQSSGKRLTYHKRRGSTRSLMGSDRRWKTPLAAMRAVDREYPVILAPGGAPAQEGK